jgi:hypothetical protein
MPLLIKARMEKKKVNKKDIGQLISESVNTTLGGIEKAKQGKKLKKLIAKSAKKIADRVAEQIKRDEKKQAKLSKQTKTLEGALAGSQPKKKKAKKENAL